MTTKEANVVTTDPICGMTVDKATALHVERDGKTFYFCSDHCRTTFVATPAGAKTEDKSKGAVDDARHAPPSVLTMNGGSSSSRSSGAGHSGATR